MKKLIATISIISALGVGAFGLNSVLPAGALGITPSSSSASDPSAPCGPGAKGKEVLDQLVANATITQAQEDAIIQAMRDAFAGDGTGGPAGHPGGLRLRVIEGMLKVSADKIGVTVEDLKAALASGQSVADVANAHSVNPSDVSAAIVDAGTARLAQAVTDGLLTQKQADALKDRLPTAADNFVNHTRPEGC